MLTKRDGFSSGLKGECARTAIPIPEICCLDKGTALQAKVPNETLWVGMFTTTIPYGLNNALRNTWYPGNTYFNCHIYAMNIVCYIHYFIVYFCYICDVII